jgi:sulfur carrier protein ThiS
MQIKVNGETVEIFSGARVKDVLRKYSRPELKRVQADEKMVCDRHGHEVALEGELSGGEELVVKKRPAPGSRS